MGILRTILFVAIAVIVVVIFVVNQVFRVLAKRYTRQQHESAAYELDHQASDEWILGEWGILQGNAAWLDDRRDPKLHGGKRAKPVSREEIGQLIEDCTKLSDKIRKAIDDEHKKFKRLPRDYRRTLNTEEHEVWHKTDNEVQLVKRKFENLLLTGW